MPKRIQVAITGGGLSGLMAAQLLHRAGVDALVLEARDRLGGRIHTVDETGRPAMDGFDLGASWVWPEAQPGLAVLVRELRLRLAPQHGEGGAVLHRTSREAPQLFRRSGNAPTDPSMRVVGGTCALIGALARDLPDGRIHLGARASGMVLGEDGARLAVERSDGSSDVVTADNVIAHLPPRLLEATITFSPALGEEIARRWQGTPTWMAPRPGGFLAGAAHARGQRDQPNRPRLCERRDRGCGAGCPRNLGKAGAASGAHAVLSPEEQLTRHVRRGKPRTHRAAAPAGRAKSARLPAARRNRVLLMTQRHWIRGATSLAIQRSARD